MTSVEKSIDDKPPRSSSTAETTTSEFRPNEGSLNPIESP